MVCGIPFTMIPPLEQIVRLSNYTLGGIYAIARSKSESIEYMADFVILNNRGECR
jgi:hypothetical protein